MAIKYNPVIPSRMPINLANPFGFQEIWLLFPTESIFNILLHIFIQPYATLFYLSYIQQTTDDMYYGLGILVHIEFLMQTSWSRGHATHNQDWDLISKNQNRSYRSWHNGNLPQGTNTIGLSRMTPRSQLIFDKSDSVRSRTEECKNHSYTLKLKKSEVIIIKAAEILAYMSLNSSWKINPNGSILVGWTDPHTKLIQKP
jgi:hypothetical protein